MNEQDLLAGLQPGAAVAVRALKYDNSPYRRWTGRLVARTAASVVLEANFGPEVEGRSPFFAGDRALEYFYFDRGYNIIAGYAPDGALRACYCNICAPASLALTGDGPEVRFVDLDIDVLVRPDGECIVTDEDEFAANGRRYGYPVAVRDAARAAVDLLLAAVRERRPPFDTIGLAGPAAGSAAR